MDSQDDESKKKELDRKIQQIMIDSSSEIIKNYELNFKRKAKEIRAKLYKENNKKGLEIPNHYERITNL